jgi:hypothetical protein
MKRSKPVRERAKLRVLRRKKTEGTVHMKRRNGTWGLVKLSKVVEEMRFRKIRLGRLSPVRLVSEDVSGR